MSVEIEAHFPYILFNLWIVGIRVPLTGMTGVNPLQNNTFSK